MGVRDVEVPKDGLLGDCPPAFLDRDRICRVGVGGRFSSRLDHRTTKSYEMYPITGDHKVFLVDAWAYQHDVWIGVTRRDRDRIEGSLNRRIGGTCSALAHDQNPGDSLDTSQLGELDAARDNSVHELQRPVSGVAGDRQSIAATGLNLKLIYLQRILGHFILTQIRRSQHHPYR